MSKRPGKHQVMLDIDDRVYSRCADMAKTASVPTGAYIRMLFEAAYAARCSETGDVDLDTAVSRVALLFGCDFDIPSIRQATGLSDSFVGRTIMAWQQEMRDRAAPIKARVAEHA